MDRLLSKVSTDFAAIDQLRCAIDRLRCAITHDKTIAFIKILNHDVYSEQFLIGGDLLIMQMSIDGAGENQRTI